MQISHPWHASLSSYPDAETDTSALPWPQGERKGMQGQIFELQKQLQSSLALNSRLSSRNALLERSTFLCAGMPKVEVCPLCSCVPDAVPLERGCCQPGNAVC